MRDRTVRLAKMSMPSSKKATLRMAQPNPTDLMRLLTIIGSRTPPRPDPAAVIPSAKARLFANQDMTALLAGVKRQQIPIGLQIPWERMSW